MSDTLQWSSPIRRNGDVNLSPIPNEIYLDIFSYIRGSSFANRTLLNLARVCRFFCAITIPWLFESVVVMPNGGNDANTPQNRAKFCRSIQNDNSNAKMLARHIKTYTMIDWDMRKEGTGLWMSPLFSLHTKAIHSMTNIQELDLRLSCITKNLLKAMTRLPQLESLKLGECHMDPEVNDKHLAKLSSLKLKKISFICMPCNFPGLFDDMDMLGGNPESFHPLFDHLNLEYITDLTSTNWHLVSRLSTIQGNLRLERIELCPELENKFDLGALMSILAKAPALRLLHISGLPKNHVTTLPNPALLPALSTLEVPPTLLASMVPGKPVEAVELRKNALIAAPNILEALALSSKPITKVRATPEIYIGVPFWEHFPDLTTLEIATYLSNDSLNGLEQVLSDLVHAWPRHPTIQSLDMQTDISNNSDLFLNLIRQHAWITNIILPKIPSLRECRFFYYVSWFYMEKDSQWKPDITPSQAEYVVNRLLVTECQDYDNCFETLRLHSKG